ncbi:MAG: hypothetical protein IT385_17385 [Deltaproteobacteria bacterium]|nr:hypothetical protein [Deltaproteobacteria bacterium]
MSEPWTIITHARCLDGMTAAWALARALPDAEVLACDPGRPPFSDAARLAGRRVVVADICFGRAWMDALAAVAADVVLLDHHQSAFDEVGDAPYATRLRLDRSGAGLAWSWAEDERGARLGADVARLVAYVEDNDLWRHALPDARAIATALLVEVDVSSFDRARPELDRMAAALGDPAPWVAAGEAILRARARDVQQAVERAQRVSLNGHDVLVVDTTPASVSDVGHALAASGPFGVCWYTRQRDGETIVHLGIRSLVRTGEALATARALGGGGHVQACGAALPARVWFDILLRGRWP